MKRKSSGLVIAAIGMFVCWSSADEVSAQTPAVGMNAIINDCGGAPASVVRRGTRCTVTVILADAEGNPVANEPFLFQRRSASSDDWRSFSRRRETDASGRAQLSFRVNRTEQFRAIADLNNDGSFDAVSTPFTVTVGPNVGSPVEGNQNAGVDPATNGGSTGQACIPAGTTTTTGNTNSSGATSNTQPGAQTGNNNSVTGSGTVTPAGSTTSSGGSSTTTGGTATSVTNTAGTSGSSFAQSPGAATSNTGQGNGFEQGTIQTSTGQTSTGQTSTGQTSAGQTSAGPTTTGQNITETPPQLSGVQSPPLVQPTTVGTGSFVGSGVGAAGAPFASEGATDVGAASSTS